MKSFRAGDTAGEQTYLKDLGTVFEGSMIRHVSDLVII